MYPARRHALRAGAALALGARLVDWTYAWAAEQPFKPERGAWLRFLRWSKFLDAENNATTDAIFREVSARARSGAYAGKLGQAAAAVLADFVVVDMFAETVTGQLSPKEAMPKAEKRAQRFYRG